MSEASVARLGDPALLAPYVQAKVQTAKEGKGGIAAYIEARDAAQILDDVVGPDRWEFTHGPPEMVGEEWWVTGKVSIRADDGAWVRKGDVGTGSMKDSTFDTAIKGAVSDCLKRCAVQWGIGRGLYRLAFEWVDLVDGRMSKRDKATIESKWAKALLAMSNGGEVIRTAASRRAAHRAGPAHRAAARRAAHRAARRRADGRAGGDRRR